MSKQKELYEKLKARVYEIIYPKGFPLEVVGEVEVNGIKIKIFTLQDLLCSLPKKVVLNIEKKGFLIIEDNPYSENNINIWIDTTKPMNTQEPEVLEKLIELLSK